MKTLGISAFYHDSAACIALDGVVVAAIQEERFTRIKNDKEFPINAIEKCLDIANIVITDIDKIVYYEKPIIKFDRILETYLAFAPRGFKNFKSSLVESLGEKLTMRSRIVRIMNEHWGSDIDWKSKILFSEHHLSHAASAFYPSPFTEAAILTVDGVGEWATTTISAGRGNGIEIFKEISFPHSLGLLYSAFTQHAGFKVNSGEYKLMGLAPYGKPIYVDQIKNNIVELKSDGSFFLNMDYFGYCTELSMINRKFEKLFNAPQRLPEASIRQIDMDMAASIQKVTEELILNLVREAKRSTGLDSLVLAGGVAMNCVANGKILQANIFKNIWIQPAAGDSGGAVGAALIGCFTYGECVRHPINSGDGMGYAYLGTEHSMDSIKLELDRQGATYTELPENELIDQATTALMDGKVIGWFQGRMEFGQRALGNRSILADPRNVNMQKDLNLKIKFRESFRPFAPSILLEDLSSWFSLGVESLYMQYVAKVLECKSSDCNVSNDIRSKIPAVVHVDGSARIQTVTNSSNRKFYSLLKSFKNKTGCPMLVNTSFNVRGEPIVESPLDAFKCFMNTDMDMLVIGNFICHKDRQNANIKFEKNEFPAD